MTAPPAELYLRDYAGPALEQHGARYRCQGRGLRWVTLSNGMQLARVRQWVWVYKREEEGEEDGTHTP